MTPSRPVPRTFDPEYGKVVRRILPAVVALLGGCGAVFLVYYPPGIGSWLALLAFGCGGGFLGLYLWFLVYRRIEFGEERVVVRRYLFPDVEGGYDEVEGVSSMGFRLGGFPVSCHTMENAAELQDILGALAESGTIEEDAGGGLSRDFRENLSATIRAVLIGAGVWLLAEATGLIPDSVPDGPASLGLILVVLLVGAPLIKRLSSG